MANFPGNSFKEQERIANGQPAGPVNTPPTQPEKYTPQKVGNAKVSSSRDTRPVGNRLRNAIIEENPKDVMGDLWWHRLLPDMKNVVYGFVNDFVMQTFGLNRPIIPTNNTSTYRTTSNNRYGPSSSPYKTYEWEKDPSYSNVRTTSLSRGSIVNGTRYDFSHITFDLEQEARDLFGEMVTTIQRNGKATVANFLQAAGLTSESQDYYYGWHDFHGGRIIRVDDGYAVIPPDPYLISRS